MGAENESALENADPAAAGTDVSRRQALGRLAAYTAPVMLAALASEAAAAVSSY
jgi:hypothetical protein